MNHCKSMATPGSKEHERHAATLKLDPKERQEFRSGAGICQKMTEQRFDFAFSTKEVMRESTNHNLKTKIEENHALPQRTPAMCIELRLSRQVGRRHPRDLRMQIGLPR